MEVSARKYFLPCGLILTGMLASIYVGEISRMRVVRTNAWPPLAGTVGAGVGVGSVAVGTSFAANASSLDRTVDSRSAYCQV